MYCPQKENEIMTYKIEFTKRAVKQLKDIPPEQAKRIMAAIRKLADSSTWGDVRMLVNHLYQYRLRVGDYRVLFDVTKENAVDIVLIEEIKKRNEGTY